MGVVQRASSVSAPSLPMLLLVCGAMALTATTAIAQDTAAPQRFAVLIAAHEGGGDLATLRYAARDATRLADVLVDVGGFARADILSVVDGDGDTVRDLMGALQRRVAETKARGQETIVVVYYSGHAENGRLRLGDERFSMGELRGLLEDTGADVRLGFIDACGAGAMTREKGATLAAPFVVKVDQQLSTTGQVIIASSSASEVSQESDEIQGSFFTHYLTTGLRGDADRDRDGKVTLDEAYTYAYGRTVAATAVTRAGAQHPTYDFDLKGSGDVVLTSPGGADVVVEFPGELEGRYFVVDLERQLFVAEVDKLRGGTTQIALPKGQYAIKKRTDAHMLISKVQARTKGVIVVDDATMQAVSFTDDYAKGTPISVSTSVDRAIGFSLAVGGGVSSVVGNVDAGLFPAMGSVFFRGRVHNFLREELALDLDFGFGQTQAVRTVDGGVLGNADFTVDVGQLQMGTAILWDQDLSALIGQEVHLLAGPRMTGLLFVHDFVGDVRPSGLDQQTYLSFAPGLEGAVAWSFASWAHLEVSGRAHYLPYTVDSLQHLGIFEAACTIWLDL
jgi:hypothetical protein